MSIGSGSEKNSTRSESRLEENLKLYKIVEFLQQANFGTFEIIESINYLSNSSRALIGTESKPIIRKMKNELFMRKEEVFRITELGDKCLNELFKIERIYIQTTLLSVRIGKTPEFSFEYDSLFDRLNNCESI
ncbi:MAG: hypothetical protein IPP71_10080 [Bacteroidetes bacterium]|nr:hypothetical protein [Bacteroidota bacterium]